MMCNLQEFIILLIMKTKIVRNVTYPREPNPPKLPNPPPPINEKNKKLNRSRMQQT